MRSLLLARGRALAGCAWAAAAVALAGCTTAATSSSISGHTLTIFVSRPPGAVGPELQDALDAEQLAFNQSGGRVGAFTVKLVQAAGNELSDNARAAIADSTTIAYLGELEPGTSGQTIGITNNEEVLQVSPTDNAVELTRASPAVPGSPGLYYESLSTNGRTFARVVPSDRLEAKALVAEIQTLGVKRLYVASDGSAYGKALRYEAGTDASAAGITVASGTQGADGVLYAGSSAEKAAATFNQAVSASPSVKLFAPSALAEDSFATSLSPAAQHALYISSPGFTAADLPPQGRQFVSAFKSAYGHPPATEAIFGYEAVHGLLRLLRRARGSAGNRGDVIHDFLSIKNHGSPVGTYSINKNGEVVFANGAPFVISRVRGGKLVAFKAVVEQG